jgi:hypothetical protein
MGMGMGMAMAMAERNTAMTPSRKPNRAQMQRMGCS